MRIAVVAVVVGGGCVAGNVDEDSDESDAGCVSAFFDVVEQRADVGTHCSGSAVDLPVVVQPRAPVTAELPSSLRLEVVDDVVRLRGTAPVTAVAIDASFDVEDACGAGVPVAFFVDPCVPAPESCSPFAARVDVVGFCLPSTISADAPFALTVSAAGCRSSSCTETLPAVCDVVVDGSHVDVRGSACVRDRSVDGCSEDCAGGDGASCDVPPLPAGDYVFTSAAGSVAVTVPADGIDDACVFED